MIKQHVLSTARSTRMFSSMDHSRRFSAHILLDAQQLSTLMHLPKFNADDARK
jgi:hypothetical protein